MLFCSYDLWRSKQGMWFDWKRNPFHVAPRHTQFDSVWNIRRGLQIFIFRVFWYALSTLSSFTGTEVLSAVITVATTFVAMTIVDLSWSMSSGGRPKFLKVPTRFPSVICFSTVTGGSSKRRPCRQWSSSFCKRPLRLEWQERCTFLP